MRRSIPTGITLFAVAATLCGCTVTVSSGGGPRAAVGLEGGGQRSVPQEYVRMWREPLTQGEWFALLRQRDHQPVAVWQGVRAGSVDKAGSGISFVGLTFRDSFSHVLEQQVIGEDALDRQPLLLLPLLADRDPEVALSAIGAYRYALPDAARADGAAELIAAAFRALLDHRDVRMRWAAVQTLGENRWLAPADIRRGLEDETDAIRATTAFHLDALVHESNTFVYDAQDRLVKGSADDVRRMADRNAALAPVLLEHLNDTHFFVRESTARNFRQLFTRWRARPNGARTQVFSPDLPARIDWVRADWATREKTRVAWRQWWEREGPAALQRAHPAAGLAQAEDADATK